MEKRLQQQCHLLLQARKNKRREFYCWGRKSWIREVKKSVTIKVGSVLNVRSSYLMTLLCPLLYRSNFTWFVWSPSVDWSSPLPSHSLRTRVRFIRALDLCSPCSVLSQERESSRPLPCLSLFILWLTPPPLPLSSRRRTSFWRPQEGREISREIP